MCDEGDPPPCPTCGGERYEETCRSCSGTGNGEMDYYGEPYGGIRQYACEDCGGSGRHIICPDCDEALLTEEVKRG